MIGKQIQDWLQKICKRYCEVLKCVWTWIVIALLIATAALVLSLCFYFLEVKPLRENYEKLILKSRLNKIEKQQPAFNMKQLDFPCRAAAGHQSEAETREDNAKYIPLPGALYIHWGKTNCSNQSNSIYSGQSGWIEYPNLETLQLPLCMPDSPSYSNPPPKGPSHPGAFIKGLDKCTTIPTSNEINLTIVPCVYCEAEQRPIKEIFPARSECPDGSWTKEYAGFLVTTRTDRNSSIASSILCIDESSEAVPGIGDAEGNLYYVGVHCKPRVGCLNPCAHDNPYTETDPLPCVMCTR